MVLTSSMSEISMTGWGNMKLEANDLQIQQQFHLCKKSLQFFQIILNIKMCNFFTFK